MLLLLPILSILRKIMNVKIINSIVLLSLEILYKLYLSQSVIFKINMNYETIYINEAKDMHN